MKEIWKDIEGFEGLYQVSNFGRVLGLKRNKIKKATLNTNKQGFKCLLVGLTRGKNSRKTFQVSRLVYKYFIDRNINGMIDFIDGDITNLRADNLICVLKTKKFDNTHSRKVLDEYTGLIYNSISDLSRIVGTDANTVRQGILNKQKKYNRYKIL